MNPRECRIAKTPKSNPSPSKKTWIQYQNHSSQKCTKLEIRFGDIFDIISGQICCNCAKLTCLSGAISSSSSIISSSDIETPQTLTVTRCHRQWESRVVFCWISWWMVVIWYIVCCTSFMSPNNRRFWMDWICMFCGLLKIIGIFSVSVGWYVLNEQKDFCLWISEIPRPRGTTCYLRKVAIKRKVDQRHMLQVYLTSIFTTQSSF